MKHLLFISALSVILFSCKKEITGEPESSLLPAKLKMQLRDSLTVSDFKKLDFKNIVSIKETQSGLSILKVPFVHPTSDAEFIVLKVENDQSFSVGKIIELTRDHSMAISMNHLKYNGNIKIYSLKKKLLLESPVTDGYVDEIHPSQSNALLVAVVPVVPLLPEVVVVASYPKEESAIPFYTYWLNLENLISQSSIVGGSESDWAFGGGGSGTSGSLPAISIDYEAIENLASIDLAKYLKCFSNIPDNGSTCTIKILTDIPVDTDPNMFFNWENGSPGHTFLQITKVNGSQSAQQNIGFYPIKAWKNALTTAPEEGKFVNNEKHEFNASLSMTLTPDQLKSTLIHMQYLANFIKYDIDDYNCTDFALEVFNYKRGGNQLSIPMYDIPGGTAPNGTATPQGLYQKIKKMASQSGPESTNIMIPGVKGFAGGSNGPCN